MQKRAMILLAVWLILMGAVQAFNLNFNGLNIVLGLLAMFSGVFVLMEHMRHA